MLIKTAVSALYAGILGGMLGIGGGIVLTPLWLNMNFPNDRVSATATSSVIFTSFSSFFTYWAGGIYEIE